MIFTSEEEIEESRKTSMNSRSFVGRIVVNGNGSMDFSLNISTIFLRNTSTTKRNQSKKYSNKSIVEEKNKGKKDAKSRSMR